MATKAGNGTEKPVKYECKYEKEGYTDKISSTSNFSTTVFGAFLMKALQS